MTTNQPGAPLNEEAIPAEQPIAASPGPEGERRRSHSGWRWLLWLLLFVVFSLAVAYQLRSPAATLKPQLPAVPLRSSAAVHARGDEIYVLRRSCSITSADVAALDHGAKSMIETAGLSAVSARALGLRCAREVPDKSVLV